MKCNRCGGAVIDAPTCTDCAWLLRLALRDVPGHVVELETVLARLTVYAAQAQRVTGGTETPVPFHHDAGRILERLHAILATWVRLVHREHYQARGVPWPLPTDRPSAMAGWLRGEVEWLRHHHAGNEAIDEVRDAVTDVRRVLDSPAGRKTDPLGPCPEPGCHGQIQAYVPRDPSQMSHCDCDTNPEHTWDSTQFMRLGKRMQRVTV